MNDKLIFLPVLIQVFFTIALYLYLGIARGKAVKAGLVNEERRGLHIDAWPEKLIKLSNNVRNQFESPIIFFVLIFMAASMGETSVLVQALAWGFVATRFLHCYIHTGSNFVPLRKKVFSVGCLILLALSLVVLKTILVA